MFVWAAFSLIIRYGRWQGVCCPAPGLRRGLTSKPLKISTPPAEPSPEHTPCQLVFQDGEYEAAAREVGLGCEVEWGLGGWMSRQRFAGRLGGKAEFPCGLTGGGGGRGASLSA